MWAEITCDDCDVTYTDEWPDLPPTPEALRAHIGEYGCPLCGSLSARAESVGTMPADLSS